MMKAKKDLKNRFRKAIFGCFLVLIGLFSGVFSGILSNGVVYADPGDDTTVVDENKDETDEDTNKDSDNRDENKDENKDENEDENKDDDKTNEDSDEEDEEEQSSNLNYITTKLTDDGCYESLGSVGWLVCPTTGKIAEAVDWLYDKIQNILVINPISMSDGSPIYEIWKYCRDLTNLVFIVFLLVVIYSQLTGLGIANYGVKKALPKLIIAAILVNLSFLVCSVAVDLSNIIGEGLRGLFASIEQSAFGEVATGTTEVVVSGGLTAAEKLGYARMYHSLAGGAAVAAAVGAVAFESGVIWMLIPVVLGAIVAVATGLITIAMRQALVVLLIMISPLAMVAYILPNTEGLFKKWRQLLTQMLVFYPVFSLLFGASSLAGLAIVASARDGFGMLLGIAVQIFPLFFSWHLMKMSGTILGTVNMKIRGLADRPLAASRVWADSHRRKTRAYNIQYGNGAYSRLQRFLNNRKELREHTTESLEKIRKNEANIYIQRKIGSGYDGTKAMGTEGNLKPNNYTRIAKDLSNTGMESEMAALDTAHTISNYGDYYVNKDIRNMVKQATEKKDTLKREKALAALRAKDAEYRRAATGANNYLELARAQMTAENDSEADFNYMVKQYLDASENNKHPDDKSSEGYKKYRHYIVSSAGGLGEVGQTRVLGKIIAKASAVESNQRRDINIIANKYPHMKREFRSMLVGYLVDDNGYAINEEGEKIEKIRGELLKNDPDKLVTWKNVDKNGPYYDWYDPSGKYVTRIYKNDKSAVKELFSNFDAPINDPINNLYEILTGIKQGDIVGKDENLKNIGLDGFRTTIGRALIPFKEKNAAMSPMVAEMIKKGYIKNYGQEFLAYLDSLNKATKTGAFNVQDSDAIDMFTMMMDPANWDTIFAEDMIRGYLNVNGEKLSGYKLDENGNVMLGDNGKPIKVDNDEATYQELMACVKEKFIFPAAHKITMMMSKQTPNTADNQKAGTIDSWKALKGVFDTKWGVNSAVGVDPYEQKGDMRQIAREVRESLHTTRDNNRNNGGGYYDNNGGNDGNGGGNDGGGGPNGGNGGPNGGGNDGGNGGPNGGNGGPNGGGNDGGNGGPNGGNPNGGPNGGGNGGGYYGGGPNRGGGRYGGGPNRGGGRYGGGFSGDSYGSGGVKGANHFREIEEIYINNQNDPYALADEFEEYCRGYPGELDLAIPEFEAFMAENSSRFNFTSDEVYSEMVRLLHQYITYYD